jgi:hypothetical protein
MSTVFIGGSRRITHLDDAVRARAKNIVNEGLSVVVGDANGADKAIQRLLADVGYRNVVVFCSGDACRNNFGDWETRHIASPDGDRDFWFYAAKDIAMSDVADYGFMIWDGESVGTLHNILNLLDRGKLVVVFFSPETRFVTVRTLAELDTLLRRCPASAVRKFDKRLGLSARIHSRQGDLGLAQ